MEMSQFDFSYNSLTSISESFSAGEYGYLINVDFLWFR